MANTSQKNQSDQSLIQLYLDGDNTAIAQLYEKYKSKIYTTIVLLVKDRSLADDLFHDTFIKIVVNIKNGKYKDQGKFLPWASCIARNICIDHFRKLKQNNTYSFDGLSIQAILNAEIYNPTNEVVDYYQTTQSLNHIINQLPEDQQEIIILRIYAELSFKEIAEKTQVSVSTALGRMRYALINMRKIIKKDNLVLQ